MRVGEGRRTIGESREGRRTIGESREGMRTIGESRGREEDDR